MSNYKIEMKLLSDTLIGSSEGFGAILDTDIIYDEIGLPYIPAKRLKGILRDSADEINEYLKKGINISEIFGAKGSKYSGKISVPNLHITDYENNKKWLSYIINQESTITKDLILDYFTAVRINTAIEDGITKEHSLRKVRVICKGFVFEGNIEINDSTTAYDLALICQNVRYIGSNRNRGLGEIQLTLKDNAGNSVNQKALSALDLEEGKK